MSPRPELRVLTSDRCLAHRVPPDFPECPERLSRIVAHLSARGWPLHQVGPSGDAWLEAVLTVHDPDYVERFRRSVARGDGVLDSADNPLSSGTWEAAVAAVEVTLAACDWMTSGPKRRAIALVRPPGHHAERDLAMGFCFFNNAAIAAERLRRGGASRVALVDFDVHHGNGSQHIFENQQEVVYVSLHQYPFYPGSGHAGERGSGEGRGATLNVPLPPGSDDAVYRRMLDELVLPVLDRFGPEALVLSAGFDAYAADPLGGMRVTAAGYREWGQRLAGFAERHCAGRCLSVLEGGYALEALPLLVEAYLEGLGGASGRCELAPGEASA